MSNSPNSENNIWRASAEAMRRDYTSCALAGLRARHYAGVFHRVERAKNPTFLANILLDGFEGSLEVKFSSVRMSVGDTQGLAKLEAGLDRLRTSLTNATSGLDVREARAAYADLASELNRTARESERLRAESIAAARAEEQAANAANDRANSLQRLRAAHDPLYASSQRYEQALREIQTLEDAGAMSASRAAMARENAAQSMLAASAANDRFAASSRVSGAAIANVGHQFQDVAVMMAAGQNPFMLAMQQGTQLSAVLNQMGDRASILSTLRAGFVALISPVSLATIGIIALGAAAVQALGDAIPPTVTFKDALEDLNTSIEEARSTASKTGDYTALREEYGRVTLAVMELIEVQRQLAQIDAASDLRAARDALFAETAGVSWMESLAGYADTAGGRVRRLRDELDLTKQEATNLEALFTASRSTNNAALHGCKQGRERIGNAYAVLTGYNRWAETNGIVVLYPQALTLPAPWWNWFGGNPNGCWDWWGYAGDDYLSQNAPQIAAIARMAAALGANFTD